MFKMQSVVAQSAAGVVPLWPACHVGVWVFPWSQPLWSLLDCSPDVSALPFPQVGVQTDDGASSWALWNPCASWRCITGKWGQGEAPSPAPTQTRQDAGILGVAP